MTVYEATAETLDAQLTAAEYVVVDFYGEHCGPCMYLAPFFQEAADDMPPIRFVKINTTKNWEIAERFGIDGVPALRFFHNGKIVHQASGGMNRETLNKHIAAMLYHAFL